MYFLEKKLDKVCTFHPQSLGQPNSTRMQNPTSQQFYLLFSLYVPSLVNDIVLLFCLKISYGNILGIISFHTGFAFEKTYQQIKLIMHFILVPYEILCIF